MSTDDTKKLPEGFDIIIARLDSFEQNVTTRLDGFENRLDGLEKRIDSFEQTVTERMDSFEQRLSALEDKVDARLQETRPIWEAVQTQVAELKETVTDLKETTEKGFRRINHRLEVISGDINLVRADLHDHEGRLEKLEGPHQ